MPTFNAIMYKSRGASNVEFFTSLAGDLVHGISSLSQVDVSDGAVCSWACVLGVVREGLS